MHVIATIVWHGVGYPVVEYAAHRWLHAHKNPYHLSHHARGWHQLSSESAVLAAVAVFAWLHLWIVASSFARYWCVHQIVHKCPHNWFPTLAKHHLIHHQVRGVNYGVSSVWVDKIAGTYKNRLKYK